MNKINNKSKVENPEREYMFKLPESAYLECQVEERKKEEEARKKFGKQWCFSNSESRRKSKEKLKKEKKIFEEEIKKGDSREEGPKYKKRTLFETYKYWNTKSKLKMSDDRDFLYEKYCKEKHLINTNNLKNNKFKVQYKLGDEIYERVELHKEKRERMVLVRGRRNKSEEKQLKDIKNDIENKKEGVMRDLKKTYTTAYSNYRWIKEREDDFQENFITYLCKRPHLIPDEYSYENWVEIPLTFDDIYGIDEAPVKFSLIQAAKLRKEMIKNKNPLYSLELYGFTLTETLSLDLNYWLLNIRPDTLKLFCDFISLKFFAKKKKMLFKHLTYSFTMLESLAKIYHKLSSVFIFIMILMKHDKEIIEFLNDRYRDGRMCEYLEYFQDYNSSKSAIANFIYIRSKMGLKEMFTTCHRFEADSDIYLTSDYEDYED